MGRLKQLPTLLICKCDILKQTDGWVNVLHSHDCHSNIAMLLVKHISIIQIGFGIQAVVIANYSSLADTLCRQTFSLTAYKLIYRGAETGTMKVIASGLVLMAVLSVSHLQGIHNSCKNNNSVKANFFDICSYSRKIHFVSTTYVSEWLFCYCTLFKLCKWSLQ